MEHFKITKVNKTDEGEIISINVVDKEYNETSISFKWDGCVDFRQYQNGFKVDDEHSEEKVRNSQYIHICEIDDMIEKLQEIKKIAQENFSKDNFETYWNKSK
ncbi:hypothetical protein CHH83_02425 [Bacillus sp. 7586-K]|nr:hypothetical protein CHH83_02425 [Bacillus sp. 7586-K]